MAGKVMLFTKDAAGLLHQVPPDQADALRASKMVSHLNISVDVVWTDAELAQRASEQAAAAQAASAAESQKQAALAVAQAKLAQLGLTVQELKELLA